MPTPPPPSRPRWPPETHWAATPFDERAAIFLRAADLLAGPWREKIAAATMLGQSKTAYQAEIDAPCELVDFWRFNVAFARQILAQQPMSVRGEWNRSDYRPLDGFVYAITPFNFTAIAGEPADRAGADGQHRGVEAVDHADIVGVSDHATAGGGRVAARGDQPGHRRRLRGFRCGAGRSAAGRHPLHRIDGDLPAAVAAGRRQHRALPQLPATGG